MARHYESELTDAEDVDRQDRDRAHVELAKDMGAEFATNMRLVNDSLDRMPAARREELESGLTSDGTRVLNDPATIRRLAQEARSAPESLTAATKAAGGNELAAFERLIADPKSSYWRGADALRLQARYRDVLRSSGNPRPSSVDFSGDGRSTRRELVVTTPTLQRQPDSRNPWAMRMWADQQQAKESKS